jgi:hypothetical protein
VVYDPDSGRVTARIAGEAAHPSEPTLAIPYCRPPRQGRPGSPTAIFAPARC